MCSRPIVGARFTARASIEAMAGHTESDSENDQPLDEYLDFRGLRERPFCR
jgi:hypothetical protein